MKTLLTSTAIAVALMGAPAFAAQHTAGFTYGDGRVASEPMFGENAFTVDPNYAYEEGYEGYTDPLTVADVEEAPLYSSVTGERIGEVEDTIVENGQLVGLVLDIGGFLGVGETTITVSPDQAQYARNPGLGDTRVYINATQEQLEDYPRYEYQAADLGTPIVDGDNAMLADDTAMATDTMATDTMTTDTEVIATDEMADGTPVVVVDESSTMSDTTMATDNTVVAQTDTMTTDTPVVTDDTMATTDTMAGGTFMRRDGTPVAAPVFGDNAFDVDPNYTVDGYEPYTDGDYNQMLTEGDVEEARLYSAVTGEEIGEVEDAISENGTVSALVLDIGGFLGLGEHTITVRPDQVSYVRDPGLLSSVRVYINATEEQLQDYPSYNADL